MPKKDIYRYGLLSPDRTPEAEAHNAPLLGPNTLGVEVTVKPLIDRCGLGHCDPQHNANGKSSAIEEALDWLLPDAGSTIVTVREDADAVGFMAILNLRAMGKTDKINKPLVSWLGKIDLVGRIRAVVEYPELAEYFEHGREVDIIYAVVHDHKLTLEEKVRKVGFLLCDGMRKEARKIQIRKPSAKRMDFSKLVTMYEDIAYIETEGHAHSARNYGDRTYLITIVRDKGTGRYSVLCRPDIIMRKDLMDALNAAEAEARGITPEELLKEGLEWGGNPSLVVSPTGKGRETVLKPEAVLKAVYDHRCEHAVK